MAKDLFSGQAGSYAAYRPGYPPELFEYIIQFVPERKAAWDCATGNGQAAVALARYFETVEATDISQGQLNHAEKKDNIHYRLCPAEQTPFADHQFDLITVAQAYHWIDWAAFEQEAHRVGKKNAVVAIWGYNLPRCTETAVDQVIRHFYYDITAPYWDPARKFVEEEYTTVTFNFDPLPNASFSMPVSWTKERMLGYFESWSAVQAYIKKNGTSPLALIDEAVNQAWLGRGDKEFTFPIFMRIGRIS
jgi:SAM-dependent methyltransferase